MRPKILFVDDEPASLAAYSPILEQEGYDVITATNVSDALKAIDRLSDIRVALTDLMLPREANGKLDGRAGVELLQAIRSGPRSIPVIVLSGYLEPYAKELVTLGVSALISKGEPDSIDTLRHCLREAIDSYEPPVDKSVAEDPTASGIRRLLIEEIEKYSPIKERTIIIPGHGPCELIKPLIGFKRDIERQMVRFPFSENIFLMMKFRDKNRELGEYIIESLANHGLRGIRADSEEWNITRNVYNPIAVLYCCKYGIALFDEPEEHQAYSPNVAYELGMMHYQNKDCLILRHNSLPSVPFDLVKDLYITYERDLQVRQLIDRWIKQILRSA